MPLKGWGDETPLDAAERAKYEQAEKERRQGMPRDVPLWGEGYISGLGYQDIDAYRRMRFQANDTRGPESIYAADQGAALGQLKSAALGNAPSAAEIQMRNQAAQAAQQQAAIAGGSRGGAGAQAAAARAASFNTANQSSQIAESAGQLRAQEMAQARDAYARYAGGYAGQDLQSQLAQRGINAGREGSYLSAEQATRDRQAGQETGYQVRTDAANERKAKRDEQATQAALTTTGQVLMMGAGGKPGDPPSDIRGKEAISPTAGALRESSDTDQLGSDLARGKIGFNEYNERASRMRHENTHEPTRAWSKPPGWDWQAAEQTAQAANETPEQATERKRRAQASVDDDVVAELLAGKRDPQTGRSWGVVSDADAKEKARAAGQQQGISATLAMLSRSGTRDAADAVSPAAAAVSLAEGRRTQPETGHRANVAARDKGADRMAPRLQPGNVAAQLSPPPPSVDDSATRLALLGGTGSLRTATPDVQMAPGLSPADMAQRQRGSDLVRDAVSFTSDERAKEAERVATQARGERDRILRELGGGQSPDVAGARAQAMRGLEAKPEDERYRHGSPPVDKLLDTLAKSSSTYQYKRPEDQPTSTPRAPTQRYAGVMAQDLERVPELGPGLVTDTPKGKVVEGGAALSALLAAVGRQQQQIDEVKYREDPRYRHTSPRRR
jgi:hypothetical protein